LFPSKTRREAQARAATKERVAKNNSKRTHSGKWEMKNHVPSGNNPKHKKFKGKDYYWCLMHKAWMNHHPNECHEKDCLEAQGREGSSNDNSNDNQSQREPRMQILSIPSSWIAPIARNDCF
jgi:hypothetical protein